jgi:hypothetical protein
MAILGGGQPIRAIHSRRRDAWGWLTRRMPDAKGAQRPLFRKQICHAP